MPQETDSVATYFTELKSLWNKYGVVINSPSCDCPRFEDYADHLSELRLIQILGGLNVPYDPTRRQILLKRVIPTFNQAYAMIIEDEIQHLTCAFIISDKSDPTTM